MIACFGLLIIGMGGMMLFKPEWMWRLRTWENSFKGVKSDRTKTWETGNKLVGVLFVVVGIGFVIYSYFAAPGSILSFPFSPTLTQAGPTPTPMP
jgi:hypothetical protein